LAVAFERLRLLLGLAGDLRRLLPGLGDDIERLLARLPVQVAFQAAADDRCNKP